jgi:serine phosphatase RsbU (regulator of sigma subunit)
VLTSAVVLAYFLFIILSTLHLDPLLCRLSGAFSAAGYSAVALYVFLRFPGVAATGALLVYSTAFSYTAFLVLAGYAAGAVAGQIRAHVISEIKEAEDRTKLKHDLGVARIIQQGLLPKAFPVLNGFDIAGWNWPADETGGDYFDWQVLPDGAVALSVADVTGHGIGPALCMSACRAYARAGFAEATSLPDFLHNMNQLLYDDLPPERFVTMAAGLLDPDESTLELISAGQGPLVFYLSAEDRFRSYDAQGVPLGLFQEFHYGYPHLVTFAPGDILALVTGGFTEWANAHDEEFGHARLKAVIRANRYKPAAAIISELHAAILRFAGSVPQPDDLTVLVIKRT